VADVPFGATLISHKGKLYPANFLLAYSLKAGLFKAATMSATNGFPTSSVRTTAQFTCSLPFSRARASVNFMPEETT
jgi:hypothetical protein